MTAVTDQPLEEASDMASAKRTNRLLIVAVVVLAGALVGLGAWALVDDGSSDSVLPAGVEQVIASYQEARNNLDAELFASIATEDFAVPYSSYPAGATGVWERGELTRTDLLHELSNAAGWIDWEMTHVGDPVVVGDGPWHVTVPTEWTISGGAWEGFTAYTVVDDGGTLLLAEASWVGTAVPVDR